MKKKNSIVIGGGAAGLMCAGFLKNAMVIEKNKSLGKKLLITGKGRCNVTNASDREVFLQNVVTNPSFLHSAYSNFTSEDTQEFFESLGVKLKIERGNRVFPESDKSSDILKALTKHIGDVEIIHSEVENIIIENGKAVGVVLKNGEQIFANNVIVATGGLSYSVTGSNGSGYEFAKRCGHSVTELRGSLVPIETNERYDLQGLTLKNIKLTVMRGEKEIFQDFGELMFTHFGISGPIVLSASSFVINNDCLVLDLKPALDEETLYKRICSDFEKYNNKNFNNSLDDLLPKKIIPIILSLSGIPLDKKVNSITKKERKSLVILLKSFTLSVKKLRPIEEAVITSGGVCVKEIDPKTMMSKKVSGLYFIGEVLDVDAYTGGFNLQIAFSTAVSAANSINSR